MQQQAPMARTEATATYLPKVGKAPKAPRTRKPVDPVERENRVIAQAMAILRQRLELPQPTAFISPTAVGQYLVAHFGTKEHRNQEVFTVLYLDSQHSLIEAVDEFYGTLGQTSVYPREIARRALLNGTSAVILSHNHPSGSTEPSRADENLTKTMKEALALVDVRVLDHFIIGRSRYASMAEMGLV